MTIGDVAVAVIAGLVVNECCDVAPTLARLMVRWSARRHYVDGARAEARGEEWAAYVNDRPGHVLKLAVAAGFLMRAAFTPRDALAARVDEPGHQPAPAPEIVFLREADVAFQDRRQRTDALDRAWWTIQDDLRVIAHPVCRLGPAERRLERLAARSEDDRWALIAKKVENLRYPARHYETPGARPNVCGQPMSGVLIYPAWEFADTPASETLEAYLAAVSDVRDDIRRVGSEGWPASRAVRALSGRRRVYPPDAVTWLSRLTWGRSEVPSALGREPVR